MKDHCNALFFTKDKLANHEKFCHSEHPLKDGVSPKTLRSKSGDELGVAVVHPIAEEKEQTGEDKVYKTMVKMSSAFFDELLWKSGNFGARCGCATEAVAGEGLKE
jgi:hypothetical protein